MRRTKPRQVTVLVSIDHEMVQAAARWLARQYDRYDLQPIVEQGGEYAIEEESLWSLRLDRSAPRAAEMEFIERIDDLSVYSIIKSKLGSFAAGWLARKTFLEQNSTTSIDIRI